MREIMDVTDRGEACSTSFEMFWTYPTEVSEVIDS
jgi:hypothetical protein